ncbi:cysteine proteinase [Sparassis latifolia]|uniref:OTU domain-containing protein n=1 Tax=Sparassis crispa TaxID=139825 RepID=A0A401GJH6_9APHY|nr:OTU domain-containing protein [Sparassis crispa]GBE82314.1 OTU domain-containing protein [Sparassis crispa]
MAGPKRSKLKKALLPSSHTSTPPNPGMNDDELMDDLMAQLDSRNQAVQAESATVINEMQIQKAADTPPPSKHDSKSRHQARQARKAAALAEKFAPADAEGDARLQKEAADEEKTIKRVCDELGVEIFEISPDGHCLFSAVADQLALISILPPGQAIYTTCRHAAADYMRSHPDDFIPFLPSSGGEDAAGATSDTGLMSQSQLEQYCVSVRDTAAWGGEPEIQALSSAFNVPIYVVQGGNPSVVMHLPSGSPDKGHVADKNVVRISYHRRMYGLGEHYNSLRPKRTLSESVRSMLHSS